jgi:hypothetical protein
MTAKLTPDRDKLQPIARAAPQPIMVPADNGTIGYNAALSQDQQTSTDTIGQVYRGTSIVRLSPLPLSASASGNAVANSSSTRIATKIVNSAIAAIPSPAPAPATGDGLIHGDAIWEIDPAYVWIRDDFTMMSFASSGTLLTSEGAWIFSGTVNAVHDSGGYPNAGNLVIPNNATANSVSYLSPGTSTSSTFATGYWPLLDYPSWKMVWNFTLGRLYNFNGGSIPVSGFSLAQTSLYIGIGCTPLNNPPTIGSATGRPPFFIGLRFDTDTTAPAISDTQFVFEAVSNNAISGSRVNTQGGTFATGITPTEGVNYRLELLCTAAGSVKVTLFTGAASVSTTFTMPLWTTAANTNNSYSSTGGIGLVNTFVGVSTFNSPVGKGSVFTVSGTSTPFDGTHTAIGVANGNIINYFKSSSGSSSGASSTVNGNPAMVPWVSFGNDTTASPTANSKVLFVDFFSFVWNPGVGGGMRTPNSLLSRYF